MNNKKLVIKKINGNDTLVGIQDVNKAGVKFTIPVSDVRVSEDMRRKVKQIDKAERMAKGSKYIQPSYSVLGQSYH